MGGDKLGDRELDLMRVLWERGEATAGDVQQALVDAGEQVAYTTVQTMLNRLEAKGVVRRRKQGRAFAYSARMQEPAAATVALGRVIDRFFGGDPAALATHLVAGTVPRRDLDRLQRLIDERRREGKQ